MFKFKEKMQYKKIRNLLDKINDDYKENINYLNSLEKLDNVEKVEELIIEIKDKNRKVKNVLDNDLYNILYAGPPEKQYKNISALLEQDSLYRKNREMFLGSYFTMLDENFQAQKPWREEDLIFYKEEDGHQYYKYNPKAFEKELKSLKATSLLLEGNDYLIEIINQLKEADSLNEEIKNNLDNIKYLLSKNELEELDDIGDEMNRLAKLIK